MLATVNPEPAAISKTSVLLISEASVAVDWVSMLEDFFFTSTIKAFPGVFFSSSVLTPYDSDESSAGGLPARIRAGFDPMLILLVSST
jgi:hypothetical protein